MNLCKMNKSELLPADTAHFSSTITISAQILIVKLAPEYTPKL